MNRARTLAASALVLILSGVAGLGAPPVGRSAATDPPAYSSSAAVRYQVTFAARSCDTYHQVMANRVGGDGTESLARLGRASTYRPGQPVDPDVEAAAGDGCQPLVGWRFALGAGYDRLGGLSVVTGTTVTTQPTSAQLPRLDAVGHPTGTVQGAVTVGLTDDQLRLAARRQLWAQGGTPADPLLTGAFGSPGPAFAVLRCGLDGHSGGNAQWIGFAAGARHAFCFAYYVRGGEAGVAEVGTVTVRVRPTRAVGYPQRFGFVSALSFADGGRFSLASGGDLAETTFTRPATPTPYPLRAELPAGWRLAELACGVSRPSGGAAAAVVVVDATVASATVTLGADDHVTCTYSVEPPSVTSSIKIYSENGGGTFRVALDGPGGGRTLTATTTPDGVPAGATGADVSALATGEYTLTLFPPPGESTAWTLSAVTCGAGPVPAAPPGGVAARVGGATARVAWTAGVPQECVLRVTHTPGSLRLRAITENGVAGGGFVVVPAGQPAVGWWAGGNTTGPGSATEFPGELPDHLPFGSYLITAIPPRSTVEGEWRLVSMVCGPGQTGAGVIVLALTSAVPDAVCTASYRLSAGTRLQVVVRTEGAPAGRASTALVEVSCLDGSGGRVVLAVENPGPATLPEPLSFLEPTTCTIGQPMSGVAKDASVLASAHLEPVPGNAPLILPGRVMVAREVPAYTVTIIDTFTVSAVRSLPARLLPSSRLWPATLVGVGMVVLGIAMLVGLVLRRRRATR